MPLRIKAAKVGRFKVVAPERRTLDGIQFDSMREMRYYAELKIRVGLGEIKDLVLQPKFPVEIADKHFCTVTLDFSYIENGKLIVVDIKSTGTRKEAAYRLRRKAAELFYDIKITEVI